MNSKIYLFGICLFVFLNSCESDRKPKNSNGDLDRAWWKEGVVYQIYPRSFKDTDADGVGDIPGIIEKQDYIKSLGIDVVWLNPVYSSPNVDNGYDVSDYEGIMLEFGTMEDFDRMLKGFHERDIKVVMDLVVNHSSDEHRWFKQSRSSRENPYRNFYHWWPAENGKPPHRYSFFDPEGEAWLYDSATQSYYLHYFDRRQPDLKWENQEVRDSVYAMMNRWFKKGIDGFRMDVIAFVSKDTTWPIITDEYIKKQYGGSWARYYADGPNLHQYLHEMNETVFRHYDIMALGEGYGVTLEQAQALVAEDREELDLFYHFEGMGLGHDPNLGFRRLKPEGWSLDEFKDVYSKWTEVFEEKGWGSIYLGNHDQPRMVSRWGNDSPEFHEVSAKMLITFLLTMRGTVFFYSGDEIGMTNLKLDTITEYRDSKILNLYKLLTSRGEDLRPYMEDWKITARENGRSPLQWSGESNAGFTTGQPWLKINDNYTTINVAEQEKDPESILHYFRKMARIRKDNLTLVYGDYDLKVPDHKQIYAFTRTLNGEKIFVALNFSDKTASMEMPDKTSVEEILVNNYETFQSDPHQLQLLPYQAIVFKILNQ